MNINVVLGNPKLSVTGDVNLIIELKETTSYYQFIDAEIPAALFLLSSESMSFQFVLDFFNFLYEVENFITNDLLPDYLVDFLSTMGDVMTISGGFIGIHMGILSGLSVDRELVGFFIGLGSYIAGVILFIALVVEHAIEAIPSSTFFGIFLGFLISGILYTLVYNYLHKGPNKYMVRWFEKFGLERPGHPSEYPKLTLKFLGIIDAILAFIDIYWKLEDLYLEDIDFDIIPENELGEVLFSTFAGFLSVFVASSVMVTTSSTVRRNKMIFSAIYSIASYVFSFIFLAIAINKLNSES